LDSLRKVFAYRLKEFRGDRTQSDFAEFLDLSLRTYQELEAGNIPQRKTMSKIVERLGLKSETPLFMDPDLIETAPKPTPTEALAVLSEAIKTPQSDELAKANARINELEQELAKMRDELFDDAEDLLSEEKQEPPRKRKST
jgi:transcriptional regulator with XRE-family HTH domain